VAATYLTYRDNYPSIGSSVASGFHNRAAFVAYQRVSVGKGHMRLIFGMIIGAALTVGGAYIADAMASTEAKPIVNWSVVAEDIDTVTALARAGWKRIAG
jgi:hypothetical protein